MINTDIDPHLAKIEKKIGYCFTDKQLGITAITTRAYSNEHAQCPDNQALEFLGDAVLSLVIAELLYEKWQHLKDNKAFIDLTPEGVMTKIRQNVVNNQYLAKCAIKHGLCKDIYTYPYDQNTVTVYLTGSSGSDIIEALIAAIYLDNNKSVKKVKKFILDFLNISTFLNNEEKLIEAVIRKNPKDALIHKYQEKKQKTPEIEYPELEDKLNKNDNTHHFVLGIRIDGILLQGITGEGPNKAIAEYDAADNAYKYLEKIDWNLHLIGNNRYITGAAV